MKCHSEEKRRLIEKLSICGKLYGFRKTDLTEETEDGAEGTNGDDYPNRWRD